MLVPSVWSLLSANRSKMFVGVSKWVSKTHREKMGEKEVAVFIS